MLDRTTAQNRSLISMSAMGDELCAIAWEQFSKVDAER